MQSAAPGRHRAPDTRPIGPLTLDEHVAELGRDRPNAITDPDVVRAIRLRVEADAAGRGAWRRVLRKIRAGR